MLLLTMDLRSAPAAGVRGLPQPEPDLAPEVAPGEVTPDEVARPDEVVGPERVVVPSRPKRPDARS